jgi:hypothetical protein
MNDFNAWVPEVAERENAEREAVMEEIALTDGGYDAWLANLDAEEREALEAEALEEVA